MTGLGNLDFAQAGQSSDQTSADHHLRGQLDTKGQSKIMPLGVRSGGYVGGFVQTGTMPITLELLNADGTTVRQLAKHASGQTRIHLVAPSDDASLRITAEQDGPTGYEFEFQFLVEKKDQIAPAQTHLSPLITALAEDIGKGNAGAVDGFWSKIERTGTPMIEPYRGDLVVMTFLARGLERNGRIVGAPSNDHEFLDRLGDSDVWFKSFIVPNTTRLSYRIARDVPEFDADARSRRIALLATAQADPLNKNPWPQNAPDVFNQESVIELSDAPVQPGMAHGTAPAGSIDSFVFESATLGNQRDITLYRPHGFDPNNPENILLVLFDSESYREEVPTPRILDNLIADGVLPSVSVAFIANPDSAARGLELPANPVFADVLAADLMPLVREKLGVDIPASRTVIAGSSYGGLASVTIALRHPHVFGSVVSMSGSFWWHPEDTPDDQNEYVSHLVATTDVKPVRMFLTAGVFETGRMGVAGILESNRHLRDVFLAKGYDVTYREYAGGHDYLVWRGALADGLIYLFGQ